MTCLCFVQSMCCMIIHDLKQGSNSLGNLSVSQSSCINFILYQFIKVEKNVIRTPAGLFSEIFCPNLKRLKVFSHTKSVLVTRQLGVWGCCEPPNGSRAKPRKFYEFSSQILSETTILPHSILSLSSFSFHKWIDS